MKRSESAESEWEEEERSDEAEDEGEPLLLNTSASFEDFIDSVSELISEPCLETFRFLDFYLRYKE